MSIHGNVGASFWWWDALPHTNQLGLGQRRWNLETSSAVVEFPPLYRIYDIYDIFELLTNQDGYYTKLK